MFPLSPLRTPLSPSQKIKNAILAYGGQGAPFYSTLQLSRYFKMLSWSYKVGFLGTIFVYESCFLAQWLVSHRTRQQGGVVTPPESFAYQDKPGTLSPCGAEKQKAGRAPPRVLLNGYAKKNGCCHFFLTLRPYRENFKHSSRTSVCGLRFRVLNTSRCRRSAAT